jgi:hypothetical protein
MYEEELKIFQNKITWEFLAHFANEEVWVISDIGQKN